MQIPFCTVVRWWRNWTAAYAQAARLNSRWADADRMPHDVGMTATELRSLAGRWPNSAHLLTRRLAVLGFDSQDVGRIESQVLPDLHAGR